ncbi:ATP-binding cassette domain-containing protein [Candidatus Phytoplasma phoenicium]|uniref:ABC-type cobalt transport system, ATPase component n=1 Tax=Candidatus Phytoplasma phoenicium TaxID=198422 RepID=A0A0L0MK49_9MOLU|nr:ATP-binding cassette domain-containing protein [Candidatus Phytoplasma phoenicium]KND62763.1 ABC-type cobalt transport system, ATPase component [Candidatus Phytoplasma phoenicium]
MAIQFNQVNFCYHKKNKYVLRNINLKIVEQNQFIAVVGTIGSGKSTLVQLMNGLLTPSTGYLKVFKQNIFPNTSSKKLFLLKRQIGLVFQFPEYQLFEISVLKDVMFAPKNFGSNEVEAQKKAIKALQQVNIDSSLFHCSPFSLSGGQQRKVAIAGILAMNPKVLILDEPTRGLDIKSQIDMMDILTKQYQEEQKTIILITHDIDLVAQYAHQVLLIDKGKILFFGSKENFFQQNTTFVAPQTFKIMKLLSQKMQIPFKPHYSRTSLLKYLKKFLQSKKES